MPLNELSWESFQRICARLAQRSGEIEFAQEYGLPGQGQEGIDIYVRRPSSSRYEVWQCKRYQGVSASDIKSAVDEFEAGEWLQKSDRFLICISAHTEDRKVADEIETQSQRLSIHNVALIPLGINQLSERLKHHPDLVDDFLGREWVRELCGHDVAEQLAHRVLNPQDVCRLRSLLRNCYTQHFETVDPGLPSLTSTIVRGPQPLRLAERFILPDLLEPRQINQMQQAPPEETTSEKTNSTTSSGPPVDSDQSSMARESARMIVVPTETRRPALDWLIEGDLSVFLGDPGIGKSSLLRYVVLDLLSPHPKHETIAIKWGTRLPVWVPFVMWTRMLAESESSCSLSDVLRVWLNKICAPPDLVALVQQALVDSRLLLFVDGLDEWSNETSARSTVALLEQFVGQHQIPAIVSSRPLGFERLGGLSGRWRRATLAGLTTDQQREFARRWFLHQVRVSRGPGDAMGVQAEEQLGTSRANDLIDEIKRDGRLARLAEIPLLLSGLIALSAQHLRLPRSRFKAYEELTRQLLEVHPQRREKACHARTSAIQLSQETRERAFARLAYEVHQAPSNDSTEKSAAREILREFLAAFLHKSDGEAFDLANQLLVVGAETFGILVEKSPQEVGFPHRAFQEFLAAQYLSYLPFEDQKQAVTTLFADPQWHDVFFVSAT